MTSDSFEIRLTEEVTLCFALACKQSSDDEDPAGKARSRHITVNKADLANSIEVLESFKLARESWELLYSLESLDKGNAAAEPLHGTAAHRSHRAVGKTEPQSLGSFRWNLLWVLTGFDLALVAIVSTPECLFTLHAPLVVQRSLLLGAALTEACADNPG